MQADRILYATDFSTNYETTMKLATSLARDSGATLVIVHVEEPPMAYGEGIAYYGVSDPAVDQQLKMLQEVVPTDPAVPFEHHLIQGAPAEAIVDFAAKQHIDLIVLGTHGRTGLSRVLMGSIAELVVRRANCPVLTVKQPDMAATKDA